MTQHQNPTRKELRQLLTDAENIAVVGASSDPCRPSHGIMKKLPAAGYRVVPVNPHETEVLGQKAYASLADVPGPIDVVNVFRRPEFTPPLATEAAAIHASSLWLQSGIWNEETAALARSRGRTVVMDECIGVVHSILDVPRKQKA
jgi:predicted CoA-binding protein